MNNNQSGYLRAAEAAELLCVSPNTVGRWAKEGKIPHTVTFGGHRRFPKAEIEKIARELVAPLTGASSTSDLYLVDTAAQPVAAVASTRFH